MQVSFEATLWSGLSQIPSEVRLLDMVTWVYVAHCAGAISRFEVRFRFKTPDSTHAYNLSNTGVELGPRGHTQAHMRLGEIPSPEWAFHILELIVVPISDSRTRYLLCQLRHAHTQANHAFNQKGRPRLLGLCLPTRCLPRWLSAVHFFQSTRHCRLEGSERCTLPRSPRESRRPLRWSGCK